MVVTPSSLGSLAGITGSGLAGSTASGAPAGDFAGTLGSAIAKVNDLQSSAEQKVTGLLAGDGQDVHTAALSVERASLAFDLMLQVRNKVVGAYQEISRLQF
ncbi:MAG: flagellar hook-basal body complex protein FliE [Candidatus Korobacteraceae bacterium]